ncbi:IclR family transcriptional regulator [Pseudogracilibacillus sp. SO30301A]|uniref:IclR family transcriptional regulator n=1 Tax=Pseudogracilibacillus sp. SO30301A TaxID=3098291 RepID=UPI00300E23A2
MEENTNIDMNQSVYNALSLLDLFNEHEELTLSEITKYTKISKSSVYRLLTSLVLKGFLGKVTYPNNVVSYRLGLRLLELGNMVYDRLELRKVAIPHMKKLRDNTQEIVHLIILENQKATYIEKIEPKQPLSLYTRVGMSVPLDNSSGSKLLLAYLPQEERDELLENLNSNQTSIQANVKPFIIRDISKNDLIKDLNVIREKGYSENYGENMGTLGISYPIRNNQGVVIAALNLSILDSIDLSKNKEQIKFYHDKISYAARCISEDLGFNKSSI